MKRRRVWLAASAALLVATVVPAQTNIVKIWESDPGVTNTSVLAVDVLSPSQITYSNDFVRVRWNFSAQNNANIVTNWNVNLHQVRIFDVYSVLSPVAGTLPANWSLSTEARTSSNYWDLIFNSISPPVGIGPNGNTGTFTVYTFVASNALNRLWIGGRWAYGTLHMHGGQPIALVCGPVGLAEPAVVADFQWSESNVVLSLTNVQPTLSYILETATNGLDGGWNSVVWAATTLPTLTVTGTVQNAQQQFWRVRGPQ